MESVPTVIIEDGKDYRIINESDFDSKTMKIYKGKLSDGSDAPAAAPAAAAPAKPEAPAPAASKSDEAEEPQDEKKAPAAKK